MWYTHKFYRYSTAIILILLIIFLIGQVNFFLIPLKNVIAAVFFPLLIAGLLYYLLRPLVHFIEKLRLPRTAAILTVFAVLILLMGAIATYAGSIVVNEFNQLMTDLPYYLDAAEKKIVEISSNVDLNLIPINEVTQKITGFVEKTLPNVGAGIFSGISAVVGFITLLLLAPIILFYLLKDEKLFSRNILGMVPARYKKEGSEILENLDRTLSAYITGQAIVSAIIGVLMYAGYLVLGLKYALILALFAMLTAVIPFIGAFIGIIPALLVGLSYPPVMLLKIVVLMVIVQQLEGNLVTPQIMGKQMNIHPLTIILLLLGAGSLFGLLGMLLAIPSYAVLKVIVGSAVKIYNAKKV